MLIEEQKPRRDALALQGSIFSGAKVQNRRVYECVCVSQWVSVCLCVQDETGAQLVKRQRDRVRERERERGQTN